MACSATFNGYGTYIRVFSTEEDCFVELPNILSDVDHLGQSCQGFCVIFMSSGRAIVICRKIGPEARNGTEQENGIEIYILQAFRVGNDSIDKALKVGCLRHLYQHGINEKIKPSSPIRQWFG